MKKFFLFLIIILSTSLWGDYYLKQVTKSGDESKQNEQYSEIWLGDNIIATISPSTSTIINGKQKTFTMLLHKDKTYIQGKIPFDIFQFLPEAQAVQKKQIFSLMNIKVAKTDERKKILNYNCVAYNLELSIVAMTVKIKMWMSTEVPFDYKKYKVLIEEQIKAAMSLNDPNKIKEISKIEGFQLGTETSISPQNSIKVEVVEIKKCSPPKGIYSIPKDYKRVDKFTSALIN